MINRSRFLHFALLIIFSFFLFSLKSGEVFAVQSQSGTNIELTVLNRVSTTTYNVLIVKNGTGSVIVTSNDGIINCGPTCSQINILNASTTILTATPDPDSTFD